MSAQVYELPMVARPLDQKMHFAWLLADAYTWVTTTFGEWLGRELNEELFPTPSPGPSGTS